MVNFRKAQTSTEYIVIFSVVIVIALVVVQIMGGFPGIGTGASKKASDYKLSTGDKIGIEKYYFTDTSALVTIKNNNYNILIVNNITLVGVVCDNTNSKIFGTAVVAFPLTLNPGQSRTINCSSSIFNSSLNNGATPSISTTYTNPNTGAGYITSESGTISSNLPTTYTVTYNGNGNDGGTVPVDNTAYAPGAMFVPASVGSLTRAGYTAMGWNSQADGLGIDRSLAFYINSSQTLYVRWFVNPTYTVTYFGNNNTGGTAPTDSNNYQAGATVNVSAVGSLTRTGYTFSGWNTQADGSGNNLTEGSNFTIGSGNVNLYAKWTSVPFYFFDSMENMSNWQCISGTCAVTGGELVLGPTDGTTVALIPTIPLDYNITLKLKMSGLYEDRLWILHRINSTVTSDNNYVIYSSTNYYYKRYEAIRNFGGSGVSFYVDGTSNSPKDVYIYRKFSIKGGQMYQYHSADGVTWTQVFSYNDLSPIQGNRLMMIVSDCYSAADKAYIDDVTIVQN